MNIAFWTPTEECDPRIALICYLSLVLYVNLLAGAASFILIAQYLSVFDRALRHELLQGLFQMSVLSGRVAELFVLKVHRAEPLHYCAGAGAGDRAAPCFSPRVTCSLTARRKGDSNRWLFIPPSLSIPLASWGRTDRTSRFMASCRWEFMCGSYQECVG